MPFAIVVMIHGLVRDENTQDEQIGGQRHRPLPLIERYGAGALRFRPGLRDGWRRGQDHSPSTTTQHRQFRHGGVSARQLRTSSVDATRFALMKPGRRKRPASSAPRSAALTLATRDPLPPGASTRTPPAHARYGLGERPGGSTSSLE